MIVLATTGAGCFTAAVHDATLGGPFVSESFAGPDAVYRADDGAVAVETCAVYRSESRSARYRTRYVLFEPQAVRDRLRVAESVGLARRDGTGRTVVTLYYPDHDRPIQGQVIPGKFEAPDATPADLPAKFRDSVRLDGSSAPRFTVVDGAARQRVMGTHYVLDDRRFGLALLPNPAARRSRSWKGGPPLFAILSPPAFVLDVVTFPIQLPLIIIALEQTGKQ